MSFPLNSRILLDRNAVHVDPSLRFGIFKLSYAVVC
jgi:hypothetical protein